MRRLCITLLCTLLYWRIVRSDEDGEGDKLHTFCREAAIPGFPRFYLSSVGDNWFITACPEESVFVNSMCSCRPKEYFDLLPIPNIAPVTEPSKTTTTPPAIWKPGRTTVTSTKTPSSSTSTTTTTTSTTATTTTATTTTSSSTTTSPIVSAVVAITAVPTVLTTREKQICEGCKLERGVGYVDHETDCDKYVMCYPIDTNGTLKGEIRQCTIGQYWDQSALTCRSSTQVACKTDKCALDPNLQSYSYESDCRGFWKCENGVSIGHCCQRGQAYKPGVGCRRDPYCNTTCDTKEKYKVGCDKRALEGNPSKFLQQIHKDQTVTMTCPPGLVFVNEICKCDYKNNAMVPTQDTVCKKELELDFQSGVKDTSGNDVHVEAFNVTISGGIACFFGDGALVVPRFANVDIGKNIEIKVRYLLHKPYSRHKRRQALVYNGDCDFTSTLVISVDSVGSYFGMSNDRGVYKHIAVEKSSKKEDNKFSTSDNLPYGPPVNTEDIWHTGLCHRWIDAHYSLHSNRMEADLNGKRRATKFNGNIARSRCGLKIGWGQDFDSFQGCIDKLSISFCPPDKL